MSDKKQILDLEDAGSGIFLTQDSAGVQEKLMIPRYFTQENIHPYDEIEWDKRTAKITSAKGEVIFEQKDVEAPNFWSQTATDIVAEKYFRGKLGTPERERSARQMIDRVAKTI